MAEFIYTGCAIVSSACAILLFKNYRKTQGRMILWVALSFAFLALNNIFVCVDLIAFPDIDMSGPIVRNAFLASAGTILVAGLLWELS